MLATHCRSEYLGYNQVNKAVKHQKIGLDSLVHSANVWLTCTGFCSLDVHTFWLIDHFHAVSSEALNKMRKLGPGICSSVSTFSDMTKYLASEA